MTTKTKNCRVTLLKGLIGLTKRQKSCVFGLGLKKIRSTRVLQATPEVLGMINKVLFLLQVDEVSS